MGVDDQGGVVSREKCHGLLSQSFDLQGERVVHKDLHSLVVPHIFVPAALHGTRVSQRSHIQTGKLAISKKLQKKNILGCTFR